MEATGDPFMARARITAGDIQKDVHAVLEEVRALRQHVDQRFDGVHTRVDGLGGRVGTVIDAIADLRVDLATHRHDG
ncbi:MAG TPA: hypothetical protein VFP61_00055 [Acidimicrobiales bacterium]|nr:hypothetical protein [Acidimicrobiales bacterium]